MQLILCFLYAEGMPNIKMMLILQFSNKIISKFSLIHKDNVQ